MGGSQGLDCTCLSLLSKLGTLYSSFGPPLGPDSLYVGVFLVCEVLP